VARRLNLRAVYERLRAHRPGLIFAALTPFGLDGPLARFGRRRP